MHGFCAIVLRSHDAENFACRGSFVRVSVLLLVDVSASVRCTCRHNICELVNKITFDIHLYYIHMCVLGVIG